VYLSSDRVSKVVQSVYSALRAIHTFLEIGMSSALYFMSRPTIRFRDFSIYSFWKPRFNPSQAIYRLGCTKLLACLEHLRPLLMHGKGVDGQAAC
jgi:hypothetical protein